MKRDAGSRPLILVGVLLMLPLAGCDHDGGSKSATTGADTGASAVSAEAGGSGTGASLGTSPLATAPDITADASAPGHGTEFCAINTELDNSDSPFVAASPEPEMTERFFTVVFPELMTRMKAATPPELVDSVKVLDDGITAFAAIVERYDWNINLAYNDKAVATLLGSDQFQTAGGKVADYCGQAD